MKTTLKSFCEKSGLSPALIRAVVSQLGGWNCARGSMLDIARHGIGGGFSGFIYTKDTTTFYRKNRAATNALTIECGEDNPVRFVLGFNCLYGVTSGEVANMLYGGRVNWDNDRTADIATALAWFAGEEVSRSYEECCDV